MKLIKTILRKKKSLLGKLQQAYKDKGLNNFEGCGLMKQLKAYKFRIYPSDEQKIFFSKTFGCVGIVYNLMLNDRIKAYEESKGNPDKKLKYPTPAKYEKEYEFLKEVDSLALANAQMNLDKAYKNFFRNKSVGFPRF